MGMARFAAMARLGRRNWIRVQGRTNAALLLVAREMHAEPANPRDFATVRGRTHGSTFELRVIQPPGSKLPLLYLSVRHFQNQAAAPLEGDGLTIPDLDPAVVRFAIEQSCSTFSMRR
jgi:hypothetical protein